jgi:TatD DNase family protein
MIPGNVFLVDTHCHLNLPAFQDDLNAVLGRAQADGIQTILVPGTDLATSHTAVELAEAHTHLFAAVGVHPHEASSWSLTSESELEDLARSACVVAIGEIGLDFFRQLSPPAVQQHVFECQLQLAKRLGLPVIVHQRQAEDEVLGALAEWLATVDNPELLAKPGVLHGFSSSPQYAQRALDLGFYLGIGGPVTFKNAAELRQTVSQLTLDRLLLETDAPYLAPQPHRGQRNEPALTRLVGLELASVKGLPFEEVASETSNNAAALFRWNNGTHNGHLF